MTDIRITWTKCYPCMYGQHFDPPQWHTWADDEDIEHAKNTGQSDPSKNPCGCECSGAAPTEEDAEKVREQIRAALPDGGKP